MSQDTQEALEEIRRMHVARLFAEYISSVLATIWDNTHE